jgi:hypothetical protein
MISFQEYLQEVKEPTGKLKDACWKGYTAVGMKMKNGKKVPNCVPTNESLKPGWMLKADPKLAAALKAKKDIAKKRQASYGNPAAGKSVKEELSADDQFDIIEEMVMSLAEEYSMDPEIVWEKFEVVDDVTLYEAAVDAKGHKSSTGGLTQKGRDAYNAKGANLKPPVTTPPSKLDPDSKAAKRRKSFCARMGGMEGPMKKPNGEPTRKALALRKWNC